MNARERMQALLDGKTLVNAIGTRFKLYDDELCYIVRNGDEWRLTPDLNDEDVIE